MSTFFLLLQKNFSCCFFNRIIIDNASRPANLCVCFFFKDLLIPRRGHLLGESGGVFELRDDAPEEFRGVEFIDNSSIKR